MYQPKAQDPGEVAYWRFVEMLEQGDPIPHSWVARAMLLGHPVEPDEAGEVAREWAALDLLEEWREALGYVRRAILGGSDYYKDVPPPQGLRKRGSAIDAILEGIGDDARAVLRRVEAALRSELLPAALLIGLLAAGTWYAVSERAK